MGRGYNYNAKEVLRVPSGIGDNIWILQTLDYKRKYNFEIARGSASNHDRVNDRAFQLFDIVPQLVESVKIGVHQYGRDGVGCNYQLNTWLEEGNRIEDFPKRRAKCLDKLDFQTFQYEMHASQLINNEAETHIGIYSSAIKNISAWNGWQPDQWVRFCRLITAKHPKVHFYLIGAEYDDTTEQIYMKVPNSTLVQGYHLGVIVELFKRLDNFFAFASGLPIISTMLKCKTLMFYPPKRPDLFPNLAYSFARKKDIATHRYIPMIWDSVDNVMKVIEEKEFI